MSFINTALNVLIAVVCILAVYVLGPEIETRFNPVYSKFKLVSSEKVPEGTRAVFQFTKFRNCDPLGYAFYNGELGASFYQINVSVQSRVTSQSRPLGTQLSYPYVMKDVSPEELASTVFAEIFSRCHPLWVTRTKVYP